MVQLGDITSVYEIALTINFILGYLITMYREHYTESVKIALTSIGEELSENDNSFILKNGRKFSKKAFARIEHLFWIAVILSIVAIFSSFLCLLLAGLMPKYMIPSWLFVISSSIFILINPVGYFIFKINILNFKYAINADGAHNNNMSNFMKNYTPFLVEQESVFQRVQWFFHFKIKYIKSVFRGKKIFYTFASLVLLVLFIIFGVIGVYKTENGIILGLPDYEKRTAHIAQIDLDVLNRADQLLLDESS